MQLARHVYLTPTPVRIWHWLNAFGIVTLCLTGAEIRFPEYAPILGNYKAAVRVHNAAGVVVAVSYALWFLYYAFVARSLVKLYVPTVQDLKRGMIRQAFYYFFYYFLGTRPNPHHATPEDKFNPLQKTAYAAVMFLFTPLVIVTGLLLMNVDPLRELVVMAGGLTLLTAAHWLLACVFCAFLIAHVYLATLGHTPFAHFKPMWTGWEEVEEHDDSKHRSAA
ncbi:MAG: cytochrome b/b6 domain-containing protein [Thermodesulfobacteriota bacterium]|jgi:thiosulfate reductase cytochrome b subunit